MAMDLPCDGDGVCMRCKVTAPTAEVVRCRTCDTPWHVPCLSARSESMASFMDWQCPDCAPQPESSSSVAVAAPMAEGASGELIGMIRDIEADKSLTELQKARRRQQLLTGGAVAPAVEKNERMDGRASDDVLDLLDKNLNCSFCMQLPERPVTTPCGHNFCLKCFQKWVGQGKLNCAKCRGPIPSKMASQPRINSALVVAIRMAKTAKSATSGGPTHVYHFMRNESRPEKAFTTERAKKAGKANACSGQIFVTVPPDHFGPILAENDPKRNQGVLVGEMWEDRMECRQWGAHLPHVAGIAGQSEYGSQSVALSGGYEDDEDHGEWFLYTGSGGRDLSGNKRTNKEQAFDQKFDKMNEALRVSCKKGYPVRVVRSHKEKRSSYAPESGVRYDGVYRIEMCWRKVGIQGFKVCRYLFVRCDNEPAPWTSDDHGDRPRPLPVIKELKKATDITERKETPSWDYKEEDGWKWVMPPPISRKSVTTANPDDRKRARKAIKNAHNSSVRERLLKEFSCLICRNVMTSPLTAPCGHNFCKSCLMGSYADQSLVRKRTWEGGRTLRAQKIVKKCPSCAIDVSDFLVNPQINRELEDLIDSLKQKTEHDNNELGGDGTEAVEKSSEERAEDQDIVGNGSNDMDDDSGENVEGTKVNGVESDGVEDSNLDDVLVMNSEPKEGDTEATNGMVPNAWQPLRKRRKVVVHRRRGNMAKKSDEVEINAEEQTKDAEGSEDDQQKPMDEVTDAEAIPDPPKNGDLYIGRRDKAVEKSRTVNTTRQTPNDGDDSPSSPLHVAEDDDDDFQ